MPTSRYQQAEASVIGESLQRLLEVGTVAQRRGLKDLICAALQEAYENTLWTNYVVDVGVPGGPPKSPSERGVEDPRLPGDEIEEEYAQIPIAVVGVTNPRKQDEALRWGCKWAESELRRVGGKIPTHPKARTKK
jgi:hypothetical protein